MPHRPKAESGQPLLETEAQRGGCGPVYDRNGARRTAEQDRLDERAVDWGLEAFEMMAGANHAISAPPPKLKKERKKLDAAKAIDNPKMIWMSRRKPPAVSPNARLSPVTIMMMTATILATGPWTDSNTCCSGSSHGIPDPAACAVAAKTSASPAA